MSENFIKLHDCKYYLTHDNGGRPFCVYVDESQNEVHIYKSSNSNNEDYAVHIGSYKFFQIFIGLSPLNKMTEFSGGHGPDFDGNSILLKIDDLKYMFIGKNIYTFTTLNNITVFESPVGNNDVPYPYAIDCEENYYFLLQDMFDSGILKIDDISKYNDPYSYFYYMLGKNFMITENIKCIHLKSKTTLFFEPIYFCHFLCCYKIIEAKYYPYNINTRSQPKEYYEDLCNRYDPIMYIEFNTKKKRLIGKEEYIELLENYNKKIGLLPLLNVEVIHKRIY
jgi:hypothetical protein